MEPLSVLNLSIYIISILFPDAEVMKSCREILFLSCQFVLVLYGMNIELKK